jgi:Lon-like ATP-dependent protease
MLIEVFFGIVIGLYFLSLLKTQKVSKISLDRGSEKELNKLKLMRSISLTVPLAEKTRPVSMNDIVGQEEGIKALRAAICGPNPQHIIIYGPPGVGKTAAARVILEEAKKNGLSPFSQFSKFVEIDATTVRFDDRGIADPLIGSVHDPIYQGAGAYGPAGIPQPKQGAVTKAHGGILFIDEIGELHPIEMNKLLKVLEDRKVFLESAYYNHEDKTIPRHIHDIFENGLPADFRLIAATTRTPADIPPALRSRCIEIFFRPLSKDEISKIVKGAAQKGDFTIEEGIEQIIAMYASNGRDAVNIVQMAGSIAIIDNRKNITRRDVEWVIEFQKYDPIVEKKVSGVKKIGIVNGLGVSGHHYGSVLEIEACIGRVESGKGKVAISGIAEQEQLNSGGRNLTFTGSARSSVQNAMTAITNIYGTDFSKYDLHIYFGGGYADGPSAGIALAVSIYASIYKLPIRNDIAFTGEISVYGNIKPVGGVSAKLEGAKRLGVKTVIIPEDNYHENFEQLGIEIIRVNHINQVLEFIIKEANKSTNKNVEAEGA